MNSDFFLTTVVMGEPSMASRKMLTCIAAGAASSVDRIKPYFLGMSVKIYATSSELI